MLLVALEDGRCRTCGAQLQIVGVDDVSLDVECTNEQCLDAYRVETDAFNDGGITYWPQAMVKFSEEL
jgi:hypothetical protein